MLNKKAVDNVKEEGFRSKAQMRLLLQRAREYPDEYNWVYDVLRNHGVPDTEGPLQTYWLPPYNKSPKTPSYTYTGRKANIESLIRIAQVFDDDSKFDSAKKLDRVVLRSVMIDEDLADKVANAFWTIRKDEVSKDPEKLAKWFDRLPEFKPFQQLNSATQEEVRRKLGDKILGR